MKKLLRVLFVFAVIALGVTPSLMAYDFDEEWLYYADGTYTPPVVGYWWVFCSGSSGHWGYWTEYEVYRDGDCG